MKLLDFVKIIQMKARYLFGIWFFYALLIFLPSKILESIGLDGLKNFGDPWLGLTMLGAFVFWIVQLIAVAREYNN